MDEAEREALVQALRSDGCWDGEECCWASFNAMLPAVDRILADREARLAAVEKVLADEPPLLRQIRADLGEGFPNELSERRGRTITGWVDRIRAALHPDPSEAAQGGGER